MIAYEREILKAQGQFEWLLEATTKAAGEGRPLHEVEKTLWDALLGIGLSILRAHVGAQGEGDLGEVMPHADGRSLRRMGEKSESRYVSVFGELDVSEYVYAERESQKIEVRPVSARLEMPDSEFSPLLEHWAQGFAVHSSFGESREAVQRILGLGISVSALENMNRRMAKQVEGFRETIEAPPPEEEGEIIVMAADCKGVPMVQDEKAPRPKGTRLTKGEKKNKKKMAAVTAVYSIDRFKRTPDDVMTDLREKNEKSEKADRPKPQNKMVRAEMTRMEGDQESNGKDRAFAAASEEIARRNPGGSKRVAVVMDGEKALWKRVLQLFPLAVFILDLYHVIEHLWGAAHAFFGEGTEEAREFVDKQLRAILEGRVGYVIGSMKQMSTKHSLRGSKKEKVDSVVTYFNNNRRCMKYDEYLAEGLPIGSGVAEGTCRHLVKDRMEQTGMRWRLEGAQAMLDLRATYINGHWKRFHDHGIEQNARRCAAQMNIINAMKHEENRDVG